MRILMSVWERSNPYDSKRKKWPGESGNPSKKKKKEKSVQNSVPMKVVIQTIKGYWYLNKNPRNQWKIPSLAFP